MTPGIPSNFANAVAPFVPMGRAPVGQESDDLKGSTLKPLQESAESARGENFRSPDQRPGEVDQRQQQLLSSQQAAERSAASVTRPQGSDSSRDQVTLSASGRAAFASETSEAIDTASVADAEPSPAVEDADGDSGSAVRSSQERLQELETRAEIQELAARDREVRQHEQAHAALGGRYAGAPQYEFVRGPDGVSYAVAGEVPIDTSRVPNDPEATIEKARQIRRAAYAPAEPSDTDRRVAAAAAQMEAEARAELRQVQAETARAEREVRSESGEQSESAPEQRADLSSERERAEAEREERRSALNEELRQRNIDTYIQLVSLGGRGSDNAAGNRLDQRV